jgi:hypothetical protein
MKASFKKMIAFIEENSATLSKLDKNLKNATKTRHENQQAYLSALADFKAAYDRLAFPGGLSQGFELLKAHDPNAIDTAIAYLIADPYFFRSGYIKKDIAVILKKAPLTKEQILLLQDCLFNAIEHKARQEYREYCRLARKIADEAFANRIRDFITHSDNVAHIKQAERMLQVIEQD